MNFYALEPEVAGNFTMHSEMDTSVHPPTVHRMHYEFDGWLGDEIIESTPSFIVTASLAARLVAASLTGFAIAPCRVSRSQEFRELYPSKRLPNFKWLQINGTPQVHDFSLSADLMLVVSEKGLAVLREGQLEHCVIAPYDAQQAIPTDRPKTGSG